MTIATGTLWASAHRPTRQVGLDPWEERLARLPGFGLGHLEAGLQEVERLVGLARARAEELCPGVGDCGERAPAGHRLRPLVALAAADFGRADPADAALAGAVAELVHLANVWLDRVDPVATPEQAARTSHVILAGDLLYSEACRLVVDLGPRSMRTMAGGMERMAGGQLRASAGPAPDEDPVEHYRSVVAARSGAMLSTAARLGGIAAGVDDETLEALAEAVERLAVTAQFADDALDRSSDMGGEEPGSLITLTDVLAARDEGAERVRSWAFTTRSAIESLPAAFGRDVLLALVDRAVGDVP